MLIIDEQALPVDGVVLDAKDSEFGSLHVEDLFDYSEVQPENKSGLAEELTLLLDNYGQSR